jgi:hypothetical protein
MDWQLRRRLLNPIERTPAGSRWWRALNEQLLRDGYEAREHALGRSGPVSSPGVLAALEFIAAPTAQNWYRAHNLTIVTGYLAHRGLAEQETRVERFFLNLVLVRMLYAHALVAAPRLALDWLAPLAPRLGDPRLGMASIFLSLSRVLPERYPAEGDLFSYVKAENGFGQLLDVGVIQPRLQQLYAWSAQELGVPELRGLLKDGVPAYAWDPRDAAPWNPAPSPLAWWARQVLPSDP